MVRWAQGADKIQELVASRDLQKVQGAEANGQPLLDKAKRTLASAAVLAETDPDSGYTLAYDAARFACTSLLAQPRPWRLPWSAWRRIRDSNGRERQICGRSAVGSVGVLPQDAWAFCRGWLVAVEWTGVVLECSLVRTVGPRTRRTACIGYAGGSRRAS